MEYLIFIHFQAIKYLGNKNKRINNPYYGKKSKCVVVLKKMKIPCDEKNIQNT